MGSRLNRMLLDWPYTRFDYSSEIRALNKESTKQANIALSLWVEDRQIHKKEDSFSNSEAQRHRKQFHRVFTAMASGEDIKKNAK